MVEVPSEEKEFQEMCWNSGNTGLVVATFEVGSSFSE